MITIRHTRAEGTLVEGTSRGDGSNVPLKGAGFRWSRELGRWYLPQSRDQASKSWKIGAAVSALEAAGFTVATEVDDTSAGRDFAEAEQERYERAERRADYHAGAAGSAASRSEAAWSAEHGILDGIPAGQPILVGHHSERRHRRDLDRAESLRRKASAEADRSEYHQGQAQVAAQFQGHREDIPRTLRRIAKLEAEERGLLRGVNGHTTGRHPYIREVPPATGAHLERLTAELASVRDQLTYWREHVTRAQEEQGVKVWSRADFQRGDFVQRRYGQWVEVIRVNAKSLTVPAILDSRPVATKDGAQYTWTDTLPYDEVRGRKSAEEMAALLAEATERKAAEALVSA